MRGQTHAWMRKPSAKIKYNTKGATMNNPPAFPSPVDNIKDPRSGMTLRDYFAAAAMQGWQKYPEIHQDKIAQMSYVLADAMLKAREQ